MAQRPFRYKSDLTLLIRFIFNTSLYTIIAVTAS
jgi:hypothetical protein